MARSRKVCNETIVQNSERKSFNEFDGLRVNRIEPSTSGVARVAYRDSSNPNVIQEFSS